MTKYTGSFEELVAHGKRYSIVYADPPWLYTKNHTADASKHYKLMAFEDLVNMQVKRIMEENAALFMWATCPRLHVAMNLIKKWGLNYRGVIYNWVKMTKDGHYLDGVGIIPTFTKPTSELVLAATICKEGRPFPIHSFNQEQVVLAPRGKHSEKPLKVATNIVELCGHISRIELFARDEKPGWDSWGNEL